MTPEIPKAKRKYLKRAERAAKHAENLSARTRNRREAQRDQQAKIAALPKESNTFKFTYSERDREHIAKKKMQAMLPMRAQAALAAAALTAEPAPHQHTPECNHAPMLEAQDAESTVALDTNTPLTPEILAEAMEKL